MRSGREEMDGKNEMRKRMRAQRRSVSASDRAAASADVCERILSRPDVKAAVAARHPFAVYLASPQELDLTLLIEHLWSAGCPVLAPAWNGENYELALHCRDGRLVAGPMGILEPEIRESAPAPKVWIVPGLAFTSDGGRLGYGGGWYDRLLSSADPSSVFLGVAYPFQVVEAVPSEPHDIVLSDVIVAASFK